MLHTVKLTNTCAIWLTLRQITQYELYISGKSIFSMQELIITHSSYLQTGHKICLNPTH
jgi:hypothetical protein